MPLSYHKCGGNGLPVVEETANGTRRVEGAHLQVDLFGAHRALKQGERGCGGGGDEHVEVWMHLQHALHERERNGRLT